jgi:polar amino acid transport system substrate-binding protein
MGVETEFKNIGFDGIIPALRAGQCDAILSSMTVTAERSEQVTFVKYAKVGPAVLVAKGNPAGIDSVDDLAGKTVAVQVGTTTKAFLERASERIEGASGDAIELQSFPKDTDAAGGLRTDRVDAWVSDSPPIADYARKNPELFEQVGGQLEPAPIAMAVRKHDRELSRALGAAVDAAYEDGSVARLLKKWQLPDIGLR